MSPKTGPSFCSCCISSSKYLTKTYLHLAAPTGAGPAEHPHRCRQTLQGTAAPARPPRCQSQMLQVSAAKQHINVPAPETGSPQAEGDIAALAQLEVVLAEKIAGTCFNTQESMYLMHLKFIGSPKGCCRGRELLLWSLCLCCQESDAAGTCSHNTQQMSPTAQHAGRKVPGRNCRRWHCQKQPSDLCINLQRAKGWPCLAELHPHGPTAIMFSLAVADYARRSR